VHDPRPRVIAAYDQLRQEYKVERRTFAEAL
jgi:hypothetical protein